MGFKPMRKEGFFSASKGDNLPKIVHKDKSFKGKTAILAALKEVEEKAGRRVYKGFSICQCCKERNGSREFVYNGWEWPEGLAHYIKKHNYKPSDDFVKEVLSNSVRSTVSKMEDAISSLTEISAAISEAAADKRKLDEKEAKALKKTVKSYEAIRGVNPRRLTKDDHAFIIKLADERVEQIRAQIGLRPKKR